MISFIEKKQAGGVSDWSAAAASNTTYTHQPHCKQANTSHQAGGETNLMII